MHTYRHNNIQEIDYLLRVVLRQCTGCVLLNVTNIMYNSAIKLRHSNGHILYIAHYWECVWCYIIYPRGPHSRGVSKE